MKRLRVAELTSLRHDGDWYGYSLALGSADVSLLMLANAYRSLANGGLWSPLRVLADPANPLAGKCLLEGCSGVFSGASRRVFSPAAAYLVADILADRSARATTFGLESWLATPYWSAAKTGTSKDMRDNWCIGASQRYTVAVWVGNADGQPMHDVSGVSGAAPVWRDVMDWLHRGDAATGRAIVDSRPPARPAGVTARQVRFERGVGREPTRQEVFIAGTETSLVRAATQREMARIIYPTNGTIVALDADIPPGRQRLALRTSAPAPANWQWRIDNRPIAKAGTTVSWLPQPGQHSLSLHEANGTQIDVVRFEVRALKSR